jgi:PPOX class probable F420-dependent enzyme
MSETLPDLARRLLDAPTFATVASLEPDGDPQLTVVWVKRDGDDVLFSTLNGRRKARNWARDPRAAVLLFDPSNPMSFVSVRGRVSMVDDPTGSLIHELSRKYDGQDFGGIIEGRVIVRVTPEHVYSQ